MKFVNVINGLYVLGYLEREGFALMALDIALPFYGDVDFMKQTVKSILNQTDPNWRLVVVDDGYPDDSIPGWFKSLGDSRIEYQRNVKNLGANGNFQKCLALLNSEYCLVMGADDLLEENYVERIHSVILQNPGIAMVHPGVKVIDENNFEISCLTFVQFKFFLLLNFNELYLSNVFELKL